jgi:hypothetical protein
MKTSLIATIALAFSLGGPLSSSALAQTTPPAPPQAVSQDGLWFTTTTFPADVVSAAPWIRPPIGQKVVANLAAIIDYLRAAPLEDTPEADRAPLIFTLPRPDGTFERFRVVDSPIMEPGLAAFLPGTRTFLGQGVDNPSAVTRFDYTQDGTGAGFHAIVLSPTGTYFVDPYTQNDRAHYTSYFKRDYTMPHTWQCDTQSVPDHIQADQGVDIMRAGPTRRTYRLANSATAEYTQFHGGTVTAGQNAIVTAINRVSAVYEVEVDVRMTLVANNSLLVFTDTNTDGFTNNNGGTLLGQNQTKIDTVIGNANYDIGHVFSTGGGGVAGLGVVCRTGQKARGVTGLTQPTGDAFYIDYVAHEMGHQFGSNHCFNGTAGSCGGGNRNASTAYEPGSASTIMGYAGICSGDNIQAHSDAYFHSISFDEIISYVTNTGTCATQTSTGNTAPTISAGVDRVIPASTPFTLTAQGSDPNGDAITYCWEERELGASQNLGAADNGSSPNFRSFLATTSPSRTFPRMAAVLGTTGIGLTEKYYSVARSAGFRVTARDNRAGNGGVNTDDMVVTVVNTGAAFALTAPTGGSAFEPGSNITVSWNVAGTTGGGINAANVAISLSTDAGATFATVLAANTPNDGSQSVTLPNINTTQARIKVEAVGNIFFNVNPGGTFSITGVAPSTPTNVAATPNPVCLGQQTSLSATVGAGEVVDWYINGCGNTLVGTGNPLLITPSANRTYFARARKLSNGLVSSGCGSVPVVVSLTPLPPTSATSDRSGFCSSDAGSISLTASGGSGGSNPVLRWFADSCGSTPIGTGSPLVIPSPTSTTTYFARWEGNCGVTDCVSTTVDVLAGPSISDQPDNLTVPSGGIASFSVAADGSGDLSYQWFKGIDEISGATSSIYTINPVGPGDAGSYSCRVSDDCGSTTSDPAQLTVNSDCPADFNHDGNADFFDYLDFAQAFDSQDPSADFNHDDSIDFFDYLDFVAAFDIGC